VHNAYALLADREFPAAHSSGDSVCESAWQGASAVFAWLPDLGLTIMQAPGTFDVKPAFEMTYAFDTRTERRHGAVKWHPRVEQTLNHAQELRGSLAPRHAPMLVRLFALVGRCFVAHCTLNLQVPPRPWTAVRQLRNCSCINVITCCAQFDKGGYLLLDSLIMRGGYSPAGPSRSQARLSHAPTPDPALLTPLQIDALREEQERASQASEVGCPSSE